MNELRFSGPLETWDHIHSDQTNLLHSLVSLGFTQHPWISQCEEFTIKIHIIDLQAATGLNEVISIPWLPKTLALNTIFLPAAADLSRIISAGGTSSAP